MNQKKTQVRCKECFDRGFITIPAEIVWSETYGTEIRDEYEVKCRCSINMETEFA